MSGFEIGFDKPWYLLLLLLIPLVWALSLRSMAGLGTLRWIVANLLRTVVLLLIVLALSKKTEFLFKASLLGRRAEGPRRKC